LKAAILLMVVVLGFFLPPVSIILMTAPIILPPLRAANFDIIWFGVVMTIVMEMGLIHPPVGLNIFVIRNVAPDIPLSEVIWGTLPFVLLTMLAVALCFFPGIWTGLPDLIKPVIICDKRVAFAQGSESDEAIHLSSCVERWIASLRS
jgi:TRAP-type C4-dicarboxylate transport system permease large subunit